MPSAPEPSGRTTRAMSANPTPPEPIPGAATRSGKATTTLSKRKRDVEAMTTRTNRAEKGHEKVFAEVLEEMVEEEVEEAEEEEEASVVPPPQAKLQATRSSRRLRGRVAESSSSESEGEEDVAAQLKKDLLFVPEEVVDEDYVEEDQLASDEEIIRRKKPTYPSPEREEKASQSEDDADMEDEEDEEGESAGIFTRKAPFGRTPYKAWVFPAESWLEGQRESTIADFVVSTLSLSLSFERGLMDATGGGGKGGRGRIDAQSPYCSVPTSDSGREVQILDRASGQGR